MRRGKSSVTIRGGEGRLLGVASVNVCISRAINWPSDRHIMREETMRRCEQIMQNTAAAGEGKSERNKSTVNHVIYHANYQSRVSMSAIAICLHSK